MGSAKRLVFRLDFNAFGKARLADVFRKSGFTRFRRAAETPFNLIFEVRR